MAEVKTQQDTAVETARRHETQAKEAVALKAEVGKLKKSNSHYVDKSSALAVQTKKLLAIAELFTPNEIRAAMARKQEQDAEKTRQDEMSRQKAAEAARAAKIESEMIRQKAMEIVNKLEIKEEAVRRVADIQNLLRHGGAVHTFAIKASEAIREAGYDTSMVNWREVEALTIRDAIEKRGQDAERVIDAITRHSPGRVNPASHQEIVDFVHQVAPRLEEKYNLEREKRDNDRSLDR